MRSTKHRRMFALLGWMSVAACDNATPITQADHLEPGAPPVFAVPILPPGLLATDSVINVPDASTGAALISDGDLTEPTLPQPSIFGAKTFVRLEYGRATAYGEHKYISNVASVAPTLEVRHLGKLLATRSALVQDHTPMLLNFPSTEPNYIVASASFHTDIDCGLRIDGFSRHAAWWDFFLGRSSTDFHQAIVSTTASPIHQTPCAATDTRVGTSYEGGGMVCAVLITFEIETGVIVDTEIINCWNTGGDQW